MRMYTNQAQVQTLADKLEFMEHQNMISDNKTLLKMVEKSKHLKGAVNRLVTSKVIYN